MSRELDPAEFSPLELDLLEDALEDLEAEGFEFASDASEALRRRLDDYRELMVLTREAMPMEDVPPGVLDGVLAQAVHGRGHLEEAPSDGAPEGFWARLRRSFALPTVVLAGTAALLLVIMQPPSAEPDSAELAALAQDEDENKPGAVADKRAPEAAVVAEEADAEEAEDAPSADEAQATAPAASALAPEPSANAALQGDDARPPAPEEKKVAPVKKDRGGYGEASKAEAEEAAVPKVEGKADAAALNEEADTLRYQGRCKEARELYLQATGGPAMHAARAYAGLGLCAEFLGDDKSAFRYFSDARAEAASIDSWIARERGKTSNMSKAKRKRASKPATTSKSKKSDVLSADESLSSL